MTKSKQLVESLLKEELKGSENCIKELNRLRNVILEVLDAIDTSANVCKLDAPMFEDLAGRIEKQARELAESLESVIDRD